MENKKNTSDEEWIFKINSVIIPMNKLLIEMAAEGIYPEVWIYKNPLATGDSELQSIEISIASNPHYSKWTKMHVDYCRIFPHAALFFKLWMPTVLIVSICKSSLFAWLVAKFSPYRNYRIPRFRRWLGLDKYDGDR